MHFTPLRHQSQLAVVHSLRVPHLTPSTRDTHPLIDPLAEASALNRVFRALCEFGCSVCVFCCLLPVLKSHFYQPTIAVPNIDKCMISELCGCPPAYVYVLDAQYTWLARLCLTYMEGLDVLCGDSFK